MADELALQVLEREHLGVAKAAVALAKAVAAFEVLQTPEAYQRMTEARRAFDKGASRVA